MFQAKHSGEVFTEHPDKLIHNQNVNIPPATHIIRDWSPTASMLSGWPVTAARVHLTGPPGWSYAPKKEVSLPSEEMFVFSVCRINSSEVDKG